jgi:hypothetical protein
MARHGQRAGFWFDRAYGHVSQRGRLRAGLVDSVMCICCGYRRPWSAATVADEPIVLPARPQPQRVLVLAAQREGVDRVLNDTHADMRVKQLVDPLPTVVKRRSLHCPAHRRRPSSSRARRCRGARTDAPRTRRCRARPSQEGRPSTCSCTVVPSGCDLALRCGLARVLWLRWQQICAYGAICAQGYVRPVEPSGPLEPHRRVPAAPPGRLWTRTPNRDVDGGAFM